MCRSSLSPPLPLSLSFHGTGWTVFASRLQQAVMVVRPCPCLWSASSGDATPSRRRFMVLVDSTMEGQQVSLKYYTQSWYGSVLHAWPSVRCGIDLVVCFVPPYDPCSSTRYPVHHLSLPPFHPFSRGIVIFALYLQLFPVQFGTTRSRVVQLVSCLTP